jgi:spore photoproduct lyase
MKDVVLKEKQGRFIKPCPGTPRHVCCGYQIIDFARGCNLGCSYCILTTYFGREKPVLFTNTEKLFTELKSFLAENLGISRFGTGEFTDSLFFEEKIPLYPRLVPYFSKRNDAILEIKTKTTRTKSLLGIREHDNTIVAWSLNSRYIAASEERGVPSIEERIEAAREVQTAGYKLAFHFDPIVVYDGWEEGYKRTIDLLFERVDPESIVYISMGTLRFPSQMRRSIPKIAAGEFIQGADNKLRYFRPLRTRVYLTMKEYLTSGVDEDILYLCMESPTVWEDVFGMVMTSDQLKARLDNACRSKFSRLRGEIKDG